MVKRTKPAMIVAAVFAAAIATAPAADAATSPGAAPAARAPGTAAQAAPATQVIHPPPAPAPHAVAEKLPVTSAAGNCSRVRSQLRADARRGVRRAWCVTVKSAPANPPAIARIPMARVAAPTARTAAPDQQSVWCSSAQQGTWWITRTGACAIGTVQATLINTNTGAVMGTATFTATQEVDLSATNTAWDEDDILTLDSLTGVPDVTVTWESSCQSSCTATDPEPWSPNEPLVKGQTVDGSTVFSDNPSPGPDSALTAYALTVSSPGANPATGTWQAGTAVRCDALVGGYPGCVEPQFTPTLTLSKAQYQDAAVEIEWAQNNLNDHWGLEGQGTALNRLADPAKRRSNHDTICDNTFVRLSSVPNDSCDEFTFAASYQSGAQLGVTSGSQCAEIIPTYNPTTGTSSVTEVNTISPSMRCVRGHVPGGQNSAVGGAYSTFIKDERVLDLGTQSTADSFWVAVTQ